MKCFSTAASLWFRCCLSSYTLGRVCVCDCVCSALVCSTCVWHYCDKAAQPLRGDGECQRPEQRSEQLPNIWMEWETHWLDGWPASPQRGSRAKGGGQVKNPKMCVWNITLSVFFSACLHMDAWNRPPKNNAHLCASHNAVLPPLPLLRSFIEYRTGQMFSLWHL